MNMPDDTPHDRPLGSLLRMVDILLDRAFADALAEEHVSRRDWMLLNAVDGTVDAPWLRERLARRSGRVRRLVERGWITGDGADWSLTEDGRRAKERLGAIVDGVRARVAGAVSPEDFATTLATLAAIARELGGDDDIRLGGDHRRGHHRHGHGFGPFGGHGADGHGHGDRSFRRGHGFGHGHFGRGFGPGFGPGVHGAPVDDTAYERGFTAGFAQGRAAASAPAS